MLQTCLKERQIYHSRFKPLKQTWERYDYPSNNTKGFAFDKLKSRSLEWVRIVQVEGRSGIITYLYQIYYRERMNCMRELPSEYLQLCPIIDEKYRVVFKLGFGRFSKVKLGINLATNERVAIKIINQRVDEGSLARGTDSRPVEQFLNELRMSLEARHRNIVQIIDFNVGGTYRRADGRTETILYYVMRIEQYGQLFRVINLSEQFSQKVARHIFRQLLSALRSMHSRSIAHCDIKSENILLDFKFNLKLVDFGCARQLADELCRPIIYQNSSAVGSIKCNAPELLNIMGKGTYQGDEVDIFAAGCFLFELVMKAQPFKSADLRDQHYSRLAGVDKKKFWEIFNLKINPSSQFKDLIEKMLNPHPKERINLQGIMKHAWTNGQTIAREQYKKQMGVRMKKVMVKVRKEQEQQMKQMFTREKAKKQAESPEPQYLAISLRRQFEDKILKLRSLISCKDDHSSYSDNSSLQEQEKEQKGKGKKQKDKNRKNIPLKEREYSKIQ